MFIEATFPGVVGLGKIGQRPQRGCDFGVRGELFAVVVSDCFDAVGERRQHASAGLHDGVGGLVRQLGELGVFRASLDVRHDGAFVIGTDYGVGLPVSDAAFCGDNGRSLINVDAVRNQPTT